MKSQPHGKSSRTNDVIVQLESSFGAVERNRALMHRVSSRPGIRFRFCHPAGDVSAVEPGGLNEVRVGCVEPKKRTRVAGLVVAEKLQCIVRDCRSKVMARDGVGEIAISSGIS